MKVSRRLVSNASKAWDARQVRPLTAQQSEIVRLIGRIDRSKITA